MYSVSVYNTALERQAMITNFISLVWEEGYNTEGVFQLECVFQEDMIGLFQLDWYCGLTDHETLMVIETIEVEDNTIIISGYPATHIFSDRVSTTVISNDVAETAMRSLFEEMDAYPCFELGDLVGLEDVFEAQTSDGTLQEYFETIAQGCDLGFRMTHDKSNKVLLFEVYKGGRVITTNIITDDDEAVLTTDDGEAVDVEDYVITEGNISGWYSTLYGNMEDIKYSLSNKEYKNVAVVAGQGEGDDRVTVYAGDTESTGLDRREMYIDARSEQQGDDETDAEYEERLIEYGEGKLIEQIKVESIEFMVSDDDLNLGDIVLCRIPEIGINVQARVVTVTETMQHDVFRREVTIGTPVVLKRY